MNDVTTCEFADSIKAYNCQRYEQCDECFMVDHLKECSGCDHLRPPNHIMDVKEAGSRGGKAKNAKLTKEQRAEAAAEARARLAEVRAHKKRLADKQ